MSDYSTSTSNRFDTTDPDDDSSTISTASSTSNQFDTTDLDDDSSTISASKQFDSTDPHDDSSTIRPMETSFIRPIETSDDSESSNVSHPPNIKRNHEYSSGDSGALVFIIGWGPFICAGAFVVVLCFYFGFKAYTMKEEESQPEVALSVHLDNDHLNEGVISVNSVSMNSISVNAISVKAVSANPKQEGHMQLVGFNTGQQIEGKNEALFRNEV